AVYRTGQRFCLSYWSYFLRGSQSKAIRDEQKNVKTYGVGADISKNNWFDYFKDLIAQGFLKQTEGQYPTIVLTEKSEAVLRGDETVELFKVTVKEDKKSSLVSAVSHDYFKDLFDDLKNMRTVFARSENVPPYVVFSDATLIEMATYLPQTEDEMRKISGVGDLKLQKYAADFLGVIKDYCKARNLASRIN
ncbi:MAG: HRDC domain-containing protein, partial [Pyrinomonadaceae bacterium]